MNKDQQNPFGEFRDDVVHEEGYTRVIIRRYRDQDNVERSWGMVHINCFSPNAAVAAVTTDGKLVLERSYRIPMKDYVIELPCGCNDMEGENSEQVARRELLEETGYGGGEFNYVAMLCDAPGVVDTEVALYVARGVSKIAEPKLGASEIIETLLIPVAEVMDYLAQSKAKVDAKVYAAVAHLLVS